MRLRLGIGCIAALAGLLIAPAASPGQSWSPAALSFGTVSLGSNSAPQTAIYSLPGTGPDTVDFDLSCAQSDCDFEIVSTTCPYNLTAVTKPYSCQASIRFSPKNTVSGTSTAIAFVRGGVETAQLPLSGQNAGAKKKAAPCKRKKKAKKGAVAAKKKCKKKGKK